MHFARLRPMCESNVLGFFLCEVFFFVVLSIGYLKSFFVFVFNSHMRTFFSLLLEIGGWGKRESNVRNIDWLPLIDSLTTDGIAA